MVLTAVPSAAQVAKKEPHTKARTGSRSRNSMNWRKKVAEKRADTDKRLSEQQEVSECSSSNG